MKRRFLNSVLIMLFLVSPILLAEDELETGNWEKMYGIKQRSLITIYTKEGDKQECRFWKIGRLRLGNLDFKDGRNGNMISDSKGVGCVNNDEKFVQMPLDVIDVITLTEDVSEVAKTVYISEGAAKNNSASPQALLVWDDPVPGSWEKITRGYYYPRSTVYTKDGRKQECENTVISPMLISPTSSDDSSEDHLTFRCMNGSRSTVHIGTETIDKLTAIDYFSGTLKTIYISKEASLAE